MKVNCPVYYQFSLLNKTLINQQKRFVSTVCGRHYHSDWMMVSRTANWSKWRSLLLKMTVFGDVTPFSLVETDRWTQIVGAVSTSEPSVSFYQTTRRNVLEDSHLHTHSRENLKSHFVLSIGVSDWRKFNTFMIRYSGIFAYCEWKLNISK
jgi:hypothetical protein